MRVVVTSDFAMSELQNLSISEEAEKTRTTKSGANEMAPTASMNEFTGITFEPWKGGRELVDAWSALWIVSGA